MIDTDYARKRYDYASDDDGGCDAKCELVKDAAKIGGAYAAEEIGGAINGAEGAIVKAAEDGVKGIGGAVAWIGGLIGSIFGGIFGALDKVGAAFGHLIGDGIGLISARAGDIWNSAWDTAWGVTVGSVRTLAKSASELITGFGHIIQGKFKKGGSEMLDAVVKDVAQIPANAVLVAAGGVASIVQTGIGVEPAGRKLSDTEITELKKVYGDSVDYSRIRIKEGDAGLFSVTKRPFTKGDTIYIPPGSSSTDIAMLTHETLHVWQHQHGGNDYMTSALWAQNVGDGYNWKKGFDEGKSFDELNPEQQAELIEDARKGGYFDTPSKGFHRGGVDYTAYVDNAMKYIRAGEGAP